MYTVRGKLSDLRSGCVMLAWSGMGGAGLKFGERLCSVQCEWGVFKAAALLTG